MPSNAEFQAKAPGYLVLLSGHFGSGKTEAACSFPKFYMVCGGKEPALLRRPDRKGLLDNLVHIESISTEEDQELKGLFAMPSAKNPVPPGSILGILAQVKELAVAGKIQTLIFDDFTYFVDMKWRSICAFEEVRSAKTGAIDKQAMYRSLGNYLDWFVSANLVTLSTRYGLNVVATCHLRRESQDTVEGNEKVTDRPGKVITTNIAPMVEGGFRNKLEGKFHASLYCENRAMPGKDGKRENRYLLHAQPVMALETRLMAKNEYGLPATTDVTDKEFFQLIKSG